MVLDRVRVSPRETKRTQGGVPQIFCGSPEEGAEDAATAAEPPEPEPEEEESPVDLHAAANTSSKTAINARPLRLRTLGTLV